MQWFLLSIYHINVFMSCRRNHTSMNGLLIYQRCNALRLWWDVSFQVWMYPLQSGLSLLHKEVEISHRPQGSRGHDRPQKKPNKESRAEFSICTSGSQVFFMIGITQVTHVLLLSMFEKGNRRLGRITAGRKRRRHMASYSCLRALESAWQENASTSLWSFPKFNRAEQKVNQKESEDPKTVSLQTWLFVNRLN